MKFFFSIAGLLACSLVRAQSMADIGIQVRITEPEKTVVAEIRPLGDLPKTDPAAIYSWYGANMIHQTQGGYSGKLLNGTYNEFYLSKALKEQGLFKKGLKTGDWKIWAENGFMKQQFTYRKGIKEGPFTLYNETGQLQESGSYHHNQLDGKVIIHQQDSLQTIYYKNGRLQAPKKSFSFWQKLPLIGKKRTGKSGDQKK